MDKKCRKFRDWLSDKDWIATAPPVVTTQKKYKIK